MLLLLLLFGLLSVKVSVCMWLACRCECRCDCVCACMCMGEHCTYNCINTSLWLTESEDPLVIAAAAVDVGPTCHTHGTRRWHCLQVCGIRSLSVAAFNATLKQTAACVHKHRTHATAYAHLHTHTHTHTNGGGSKDNNNSRRPGCGRLLSDFNTLRMKIAKRQRRGVDNYPLIA